MYTGCLMEKSPSLLMNYLNSVLQCLVDQADQHHSCSPVCQYLMHRHDKAMSRSYHSIDTKESNYYKCLHRAILNIICGICFARSIIPTQSRKYHCTGTFINKNLHHLPQTSKLLQIRSSNLIHLCQMKYQRSLPIERSRSVKH